MTQSGISNPVCILSSQHYSLFYLFVVIPSDVAPLCHNKDAKFLFYLRLNQWHYTIT